jgi:hypothetical protein
LRWRTFNQVVAQSLMISFAMIVGHELSDGASKMSLAQWNQAIEAFLID